MLCAVYLRSMPVSCGRLFVPDAWPLVGHSRDALVCVVSAGVHAAFESRGWQGPVCERGASVNSTCVSVHALWVCGVAPLQPVVDDKTGWFIVLQQQLQLQPKHVAYVTASCWRVVCHAYCMREPAA